MVYKNCEILRRHVNISPNGNFFMEISRGYELKEHENKEEFLT
jgi:hypothetical protein